MYTQVSRINTEKTLPFKQLRFAEKAHDNNLQERPLMQSIKGRRLIVYACVICWTTRNNQGQSPLSL